VTKLWKVCGQLCCGWGCSSSKQWPPPDYDVVALTSSNQKQQHLMPNN